MLLRNTVSFVNSILVRVSFLKYLYTDMPQYEIPNLLSRPLYTHISENVFISITFRNTTTRFPSHALISVFLSFT